MAFDPVVAKAVSISLVVLCYVLLVFKHRIRLSSAAISCGTAALLVLFGTVLGFFGPVEALKSINLNVLAVFWGAMNISHVFATSGAPAWIGEKTLKKVKTQAGAIIVLATIAAVISAFVENVATVIILIPIAKEVAKRTKSSMIPYVVAIAVASTMEGCVTMIGDSQSIILALNTGMSFNDFFWFQGRPGIAFLFIIATIAAFVLLWHMLRDMRKPLAFKEEGRGRLDIKPTLLLIGFISAMALSQPLHVPIWIISIIAGFAALALSRDPKLALRGFSWETMFFIASIFVVVASLNASGVLNDVAGIVSAASMDNSFVAVAIITWFSVLASAFIDNVPYVTMMIPICISTAAEIGCSQWLLLFGMMVGACLGGNISPIGTTANVAAYGILEKEGEPITFGKFTKIALPVTLVSVAAAFAALLVIWG